MLGSFEGDAPYEAVHFAALLEEKLRRVRTVLARNAGDQRAFRHVSSAISAAP
jgi:hypothetical protein